MEGVINFPLLNLTIDALSLSANLVNSTLKESNLDTPLRRRVFYPLN